MLPRTRVLRRPGRSIGRRLRRAAPSTAARRQDNRMDLARAWLRGRAEGRVLPCLRACSGASDAFPASPTDRTNSHVRLGDAFVPHADLDVVPPRRGAVVRSSFALDRRSSPTNTRSSVGGAPVQIDTSSPPGSLGERRRRGDRSPPRRLVPSTLRVCCRNRRADLRRSDGGVDSTSVGSSTTDFPRNRDEKEGRMQRL